MVKFSKVKIKVFKVGDKVTFIKDKEYNKCENGKTGIIVQERGTDNCMWGVKIESKENYGYHNAYQKKDLMVVING